MTPDDLLALAARGAPLPEQRDALASVLAASGVVASVIDAVMDTVCDGVVLRAEDGGGSSRLGGPGVLPAGETWPSDPRGVPLAFIARIDLGELPRLDPLPPDGALLFYWDFDFFELERMDWLVSSRVYWVPPGEALEESTEGGFDPVPLRGLLMPIAGQPANAHEAFDDAAYDALDAIDLAVYEHQLLGRSRDVQGPVLDEIPYWFEQAFAETRDRFTAAERAGDGWVLLAQFDSTEEMMFGDAGCVYYVMPRADLEARRFDRVLGIMQCA